MLRCLFFGRDQFGLQVLRYILSEGRHQIVGVVSPHIIEESILLEKEAEQLMVPFLRPLDVNGTEFLKEVSRLRPDLNVCVNYNSILHRDLIDIPKHSTINLHCGLCPNYRGGGGIYGAVINRETEFGITVHYMDSGIDTGPILSQEQLAILPKDNMANLHGKVEKVAPFSVHKVLDQIDESIAVPVPQEEMKGSYFPKKPIGDEIVDWSESSQLIYDRIRARNPGPLNATYLGKVKIIIRTASLTDYPIYVGTVGQVIAVEKGCGTIVKTGDSAIRIEQISYVDTPDEHMIANFPRGTTFLSNWRQSYLSLLEDNDSLLKRVENLERIIRKMTDQ